VVPEQPARAGRFVHTKYVDDPPRRRSTVTCVIPALNEERNIVGVLKRLPACVDEVILVDGDSVDDTVSVSRRVRPDIRVVGQDRRGKGAALRAGFAAATGDVIVMIDADGSMDPAEIERFLAALQEGFDLVKGSRFLAEGGTSDMEAVRRWGNAALRDMVNALFGVTFTDLCYGYMAFRRDVLDDLCLRADGFEIETEITVRALNAGLRVAEVPSIEAARCHGESNLRTWRDGSRVLATLVRHRFSRPMPVSEALPDALTADAILTERAS
jgi:glycosyltransferase involved in cell wall biosynthesis